jgi:endonuclease/exonuclease/phosphatase family metal-dependent hydrolase
MCTIRILSWNLRTFGTHQVNDQDLQRIASIILQSQADVVSIQELMIGQGVSGEIGSAISDASMQLIVNLTFRLQAGDEGGKWAGAWSGVDSGFSDHMRDAYAFLWKSTPSQSKLAHSNAPDALIDLLPNPVILRQEGQDHFPGRRPAMMMFNVQCGSNVTPFNVISYHAPTPCNRFSKGVGSGYGINALATLSEIGGGINKSNGRQWSYADTVTPLPQVDTVVLGDFNYTMDDKWAQFTYTNLLTNYQACVSTPEKPVYTTYGPKGTEALRLVSAYDNIFVLSKHSSFTPALNFTGSSGAIDFIAEDAKRLGEAAEIRDFATETAWYVIFVDQYKKQHAQRGISDHLPVWADFQVTKPGSTAQKILPTAGDGNNCLLHAVLGTVTNGVYLDANAAADRQLIVTTLAQYKTNGAFPNDGGLIRRAVIASMINEFAYVPTIRNGLSALLGNNVNPFQFAEFVEAYGYYVAQITGGRMLYVEEIELVAQIWNCTVVLNYIYKGQYATQTFNAGKAATVNIYHQGLHFCRWQA